MGSIKYEIVKKISVIVENEYEPVELNIIKWNNRAPKYDLRKWRDGEPLKGLTLNEDEADTLFWALAGELGYKNRILPELVSEKNDEEEVEEYEDHDDTEDDSTPIDYRSFFVINSLDQCKRRGHHICDVEAQVPMMIGNTFKYINFPAVYCKVCNVFYISQTVYSQLHNNGKVLCQLLTMEEYKQYREGFNNDNLSPKGPLNLLGYSVSEGGLSTAERRQLLDWIIGNKIMDKSRVISYLKFFIRSRQGQANMSAAVDKWMSDKKYLEGIDSYSKGTQAYPPTGVVRFINGRPKISDDDCLPFS